MEEQKSESTTSSEKVKVIHVKVIDGGPADIYEIGNAMKEFKKSLPYRLEAIVTNDKIVLQDVDAFIRELVKLKKQIQKEDQFKWNIKKDIF